MNDTTLVDVPPGVVTVTVAAPATPAGAVAVTDVADTTTTFAAAFAPNFTPVAPVRFEPVIVTTVPPATGPLVGLNAVTVGAATYVNETAFADVPPAVVAVTVAAPATPAGVVALIDVADTNVTAVPAFAPNFTVVAPDTNPLPVIVTTVPAVTGPLVGLNNVTVGTARYVNETAFVEVPLVVVAVTVTAPAVPAGVVALIDVAEVKTMLVPTFAPNFTVVPPDTNPVPVIVTTVPPASGPLLAVTAVTVGAVAAAAGAAGSPRPRPSVVSAVTVNTARKRRRTDVG
ncbi:unannotated protein [freshwater metagenome]|uniref:Unannotated protein n=1 Tax=freshwater metagenome TaxID=449393 RepID=A0A6J7FV12_9ZZZZ